MTSADQNKTRIEHKLNTKGGETKFSAVQTRVGIEPCF